MDLLYQQMIVVGCVFSCKKFTCLLIVLGLPLPVRKSGAVVVVGCGQRSDRGTRLETVFPLVLCKTAGQLALGILYVNDTLEPLCPGKIKMPSLKRRTVKGKITKLRLHGVSRGHIPSLPVPVESCSPGRMLPRAVSS